MYRYLIKVWLCSLLLSTLIVNLTAYSDGEFGIKDGLLFFALWYAYGLLFSFPTLALCFLLIFLLSGHGITTFWFKIIVILTASIGTFITTAVVLDMHYSALTIYNTGSIILFGLLFNPKERASEINII